MSKTQVNHKKGMEAKNNRSAKQAESEEKHSKGILNFIKKHSPEKKDATERMQQKKGIFALFKRKEENALDKKPKGKDEVTDKLLKPKLGIFSFFRKKETVKEEGTIESYKKQIKKQQRRIETSQKRKHNLLDYIERAVLSIPH